MLDSLHKSILWIVRMSVLHDFCRAWFRVTEGRTSKMYSNCFHMPWPSKATALPYDQPQLRVDTCHSEGVQRGTAPVETGLLSHQLLSCSLFLISQEALRGRCLDCHHSTSLYFHTVVNSHMLSFPSLSTFISVKAHIHLIFLSLSALLIYSSRGWVSVHLVS